MSFVTGLIKKYDDFKLNIPKLEIADEGITILWEPSGAGKTRVFRNLIGIESCPGLSWHLHGVDVCQLPAPDRKFGVVLQNYSLFPHMTARQNIQFAADAREITNEHEKMHQLKKELSLEDCWDRTAAKLSSGEQQRVALARALIGEPQFLFLDEPFSALDQNLRSEARELVKKIIHEHKIPTLLINHDKEDVEQLTGKIIKIEKGQLAE
ncbi:MAG: ATP-binding cassette domain-containing protein [Bdellovibrionaceae bacterium]|nr:ATP-binding cassette domain-containing protein [Pseudobdellovibrionaceae bacterium]